MKDREIWWIVIAFAMLFAITLLEMRKWLPAGRAKFAIVFLAGAAIAGSLFLAGIPPDWFDGSTAAFLVAGSLLLGAFVVHDTEGGRFGTPLLAGMGLTLAVLNVWAHV